MSKTLHRSMVGGLQYLTLSQKDIAFVVNQLCQFMKHPQSSHLQAIKWIYCYINGTIVHGLPINDLPITLFSLSLTPIGQDSLISNTQLQVFAYSLVPIFSHGQPRNNLPSLDPVLRQNIVPLLPPSQKFDGLSTFFANLVFNCDLQFVYFVTISLHFIWLQIQSSMSK